MLSFTSSGATPQTDNSFLAGYKPQANSFLAGRSTQPAAAALNNAQTPPPAASTPLKKTTTNNVDGSSVVHEYHAPDVNSGSNSQAYKDATTSAQTAAKTIGGSYTPETGYTPGILGGGSTSTPATSTGTSYGPSTGPNSGRLDVNGNLLSTGTPAPQATFPGIVNNLANTSQIGSQNATTATTGLLNSQSANDSLKQQAQEIGDKYGSQIMKTSNYGNALAGSYTNGAGLAPVSQGLAGQAQQTTAAEVAGQKAAEDAALAPIDRELTAQSQAQSGLASAGSTANIQQSNVQSGLNSAGNLSQPELATYNQQPYSPTTNSFGASGQSGSSGSGLPPQGDALVNSLAQQVQNNQMTRTDAESRLSAYGQPGISALNSALGSEFNTIESNANASATGSNLAATSAQAQQTQQAVAYASQVLDDLIQAYNSQGSLQKTGIPLVNAGANLLSQLSGFGITATQGYSSTTGEALAAVSQALASGGITPTSAGAIAGQLIPPNATPGQIKAAKDYLNTFLSQRQSTYTTPPTPAQYGGSTNTNQNGPSTLYGW